MIEINSFLLFSFINGIVLFLGFSFLSLRQLFEFYNKPVDALTGLRRRIFYVLFLAAVTSIPTLTYQAMQLMGIESEVVQNFVRVTSVINRDLMFIGLVSIMYYRIKSR